MSKYALLGVDTELVGELCEIFWNEFEGVVVRICKAACCMGELLLRENEHGTGCGGDGIFAYSQSVRDFLFIEFGLELHVLFVLVGLSLQASMVLKVRRLL